MSDTREGVQDEFNHDFAKQAKYALFNIYVDKARNGELTLEQAVVEYMIEVSWLEHDGTSPVQPD